MGMGVGLNLRKRWLYVENDSFSKSQNIHFPSEGSKYEIRILIIFKAYVMLSGKTHHMLYRAILQKSKN